MISRTVVALCSAVAFAVIAGPVLAQKGKPGSGGGGNTLVPVTAEFRCPLTEACLVLDQIQGDTLGPYRGTTPEGSATTQEGQAANMGGYFTEGNLFLFSLKAGLGRFVSLDFAHSSGVAPCAAANTCRRNFAAASTDVSLPGSRTYPVDAMGTDLPNGFMSIAVGQTAQARWFFNFADPSGRDLLWTVRFDPPNYPGSTYLSVTRVAVDSWILEAADSDVAELVSATTTNGRSVKVNEGYFSLPFRIVVTK